MWDDIAGAYGSRFLLAAGGVGLALLLLIGILWLLRSRAPSPFVRGGKNRQPRLQVLDAAAVDARRRLVLIRRDGIEHLIMIGGPTDIVIESGISDPATAGATTPAAPADVSITAERRLEQALEPRLEPQPAPQPPLPPEARIEASTKTEPTLAAEPIARVATPAVELPLPPATPQHAVQSAAILTAAEAADILDAARHVVLPQEQPRAVAAAPTVAPPPVREPDSDFQRVLEAEMANNLTAERIIPNVPQQRQAQQQPAPVTAQRRDPELAPPITGSDAALQKEVARIFGEMSVNRDK